MNSRAGYDYFRALADEEGRKGRRESAERYHERATAHALQATLAAAALQHLAATSFRIGSRSL